ncbi:hypothetical protein FK531_14165 [Rhodococcus spelaei]|uniref:Uncharacterized protein n=1 Tax=Rhodococcus spelaei TaxID=2546320 RepID=A0A541B7H3_9NOCA|nr:hypothetical protein [Rhodococcus spelaei]TQF68250.1 hypothetical protein FK531_14165 [Rhodococcus spelaei]
MTAESADRTLPVFVPGWVLDDRSLAPPALGDLVDVVLTFDPTDPTVPGAHTVRATVRPLLGLTPYGEPDGELRWPHEVVGDGWSAEWLSDRPLAGRVELTGRLFAGISWTASDDPVRVRGRVRRVRVVEHRVDRTDRGLRAVDGTERLTDVEAAPRRFWSNWDVQSEDHFQETGVLIDLDVDDVPATEVGFVAGAVAVHGADVWVMDRSNPFLLHVDTAATPPRVVEYLLPLTIESPKDQWTRTVHADRGGCWIASRHDVFRCDRTGDAAVTIERVCAEGGNYSSVVDGRLFLVGTTRPALHTDRRYGMVRVDADAHPVRMLDDELRLVPVDDPATVARVTAQRRRADTAHAADGTEWVAVGDLTAQSPDGTRRQVDLDVRTRGTMHWVQPDPYADPANAELLASMWVSPPVPRKPTP